MVQIVLMMMKTMEVNEEEKGGLLLQLFCKPDKVKFQPADQIYHGTNIKNVFKNIQEMKKKRKKIGS